jgi:hypothetical protein
VLTFSLLRTNQALIGWTVRVEKKSIVHAHSLYLTHFARFLFLYTLHYYRAWDPFSTCNENLSISAPGDKIWGLNVPSSGDVGPDYGPYRVATGTSMAAAHVSGIAAKIWSQCPSCTNLQVTSCLKSSAAALGRGDYAWCFGAGLVQAEDAYLCLTDAAQANCC